MCKTNPCHLTNCKRVICIATEGWIGITADKIYTIAEFVSCKCGKHAVRLVGVVGGIVECPDCKYSDNSLYPCKLFREIEDEHFADRILESISNKQLVSK